MKKEKTNKHFEKNHSAFFIAQGLFAESKKTNPLCPEQFSFMEKRCK